MAHKFVSTITLHLNLASIWVARASYECVLSAVLGPAALPYPGSRTRSRRAACSALSSADVRFVPFALVVLMLESCNNSFKVFSHYVHPALQDVGSGEVLLAARPKSFCFRVFDDSTIYQTLPVSSKLVTFLTLRLELASVLFSCT